MKDEVKPREWWALLENNAGGHDHGRINQFEFNIPGSFKVVCAEDYDALKLKYDALEKRAEGLVEALRVNKFALQAMIIHWNGSVPGLTDQQVWDGAIDARDKAKLALAAWEDKS